MLGIEEKIKGLVNELKISRYEIMQRYMFERFLERVSISKYKENFILKGGLLLSAVLGVVNRSTTDVDSTILNLDIKNIENIIKEILNIELSDGVKITIESIDNKKDDIYAPISIRLLGKFKTTKIFFDLDLNIGDSVIPRALDYKYNSIFEDLSFNILTYNIETILAEKIETILRRGKYNTRMKDFYDVYLLLNKFNIINIEIFNIAIKSTIINRDSTKYLSDFKIILKDIVCDEKINKIWNIYLNKHKFVINTSFKDIIDLIGKLLKSSGYVL